MATRLDIRMICTTTCPAMLGISSREETARFTTMMQARDPTFKVVMAPFRGTTHEIRMADAKLAVETITRLAGIPISYDQVNPALFVAASLDWGTRPGVLFTFTHEDEYLFDGMKIEIRNDPAEADAAWEEIKKAKGETRDGGSGAKNGTGKA